MGLIDSTHTHPHIKSTHYVHVCPQDSGVCGSGSDHGSSEENCVDESTLYKVYGVRKEKRETEREKERDGDIYCFVVGWGED